MTEQPRDWDKELANIDRAMARQPAATPGSAAPAAKPQPKPEPAKAEVPPAPKEAPKVAPQPEPKPAERAAPAGEGTVVPAGPATRALARDLGVNLGQVASSGPNAAGLDITINDPGNAEQAITVGSTHRDMPHVYGVSFFSSKGPTGDGRMKPDLVAPGEKIISCMSKDMKDGKSSADKAFYREESGTSMSAPHVSGVIAAFLSVRREFIGRPETVKEIFLNTATDLKRSVYFQGKGLVDLMRAIQSV